MLTKKHNPINDLLDVTISSAYVSFIKPRDVNLVLTEDITKKMIEEIPTILIGEKRGYKKIEGLISKIELHREHYVNALVELVETFEGLTTPQTRTSSKLLGQMEERKRMLTTFNDKFIRMYAESQGCDLSDIILPDDREKLEEMIIETLGKEG